VLNRIILIGRLVADPMVRYTTNEIKVANFRIAVDRPYTNQKGERETDYIDIVCWRKLAEVVGNNLKRGRLVAVDGRLQLRTYEYEGKQRVATEVLAEDVRFLDRREPSAADAPPQYRPEEPPVPHYNQPFSQPFGQPYGQPVPPMNQPYGQPQGQPQGQPYGQPQGPPQGPPPSQPYGQPQSQPQGQPQNQPFGQPFGQPFNQQISQPAEQEDEDNEETQDDVPF
jgi:single-strand DNA-binding protein